MTSSGTTKNVNHIPVQQSNFKRNRFAYGIGTIGRDMLYSMVSMYLMFYLTDVLQVPTATMWYVTGAIMFTKLFDAVNDPFMGVLVDNTRTRWGKFKPWILLGVVLASVMTVLMFTDFKLQGMEFVLMFLIVYLLWEISYTANDIAYWSMLPALSQDQKERERIGAIARICANIGLFSMVVGITPMTQWLGELTGSMQLGYFWLSVIVSVIMILFQLVTVIFVKEDRTTLVEGEKTSVKDMFNVILKNDQLVWMTVAMCLFNIGFHTTTSFGQYYFKYYYGDINLYPVFGLILGIAQITSLSIFPMVSRRVSREKIYLYSIVLILIGYGGFALAAPKAIVQVAGSALLIFIGQAAIQLIILMLITDCVEYGEWKNGTRNESVTLSLSPLVTKVGSSVASGIIGVTVIISGIKGASGPADVSAQGIRIFQFAMFLLPAVSILASYLIYRKKYIIDAEKFATILRELNERTGRES